ncbi:MAG: flagellar assembly protein FliX [Caulobacteraceae bacterium]
MKVNGSAPMGVAGATTPRPARDTEGGFAPSSASESTQAAATERPAAMAPATSLDILLALQETLTPQEKRRRATKRGHGILDALDALKLAVLDPEDVETGALQRLQEAVRAARDETEDPNLDEVLDHIELRAAVELAKRGQGGSAI